MPQIPIQATAQVEHECTCGKALNAYIIREGDGYSVLQVEPCPDCEVKHHGEGYERGIADAKTETA